VVALLHAAKGARAGPTAVDQVRQLMQEHGVLLSVQLGTALISCCRHAGPERDAQHAAVTRAQEVLCSMKAKGIAPNARTFNSLLGVYANSGDAAGVERVLGELELSPDVEATEETWGIALAVYQAAGWWGHVEAVEALRDTLRTLQGRV